MRGGDSLDELAVECRRVGRRQIGRDHDSALDHGPAASIAANELGDHLSSYTRHVFRPRPEIVVVEAPVAGCHGLGSRVPRLRRVEPVLEDGPSRRLEQRFVIEEEEMSVEDRRVVLARPGGDRLTCGLDLLPHALEGALERLPLRGRIARRTGRDLRLRRAKVTGGSKRRSGRTGEPLQRAVAGACGWRGTGRRRRGSGLLPLVEIALGQRGQRSKDLICLRPARRDEHLVALPHPERRQLVQTPPARGPTAGRHIGGGHIGVEAPSGLNEARCRARVQAERVPHLQRDSRGFVIGAWLDRCLLLAGAEMGDLRLERAAGLGRHLLQRGAELGRDGSRDCPFN